MLVLSRKEGEAITIGDSVRVQVVEMRRGQVRLGVEAPPDLAIWREELGISRLAPSPAPAAELLQRLRLALWHLENPQSPPTALTLAAMRAAIGGAKTERPARSTSGPA